LAESGAPSAPRPAAPPASPGTTAVAVLSAWLVPGLGHVYLKRPLRGLIFFGLIVIAILVGFRLEGHLYRGVPGQPLSYLATFASMGMGFIYFLLRYALHYEGNVMGAGYEYGTAFLITAALMNLLLVLDAWDIAQGKKE
jgi:hypothetical protein